MSEAPLRRARRFVLASLPDVGATTNPYQRLLYESLGELGFVLVPCPRLCSGWLWGSRRNVGCLHFHWLTAYYHHDLWIGRLGRLILLTQRLILARLLGYRIVWTVHEIDPHVRRSRADKIAPRVVAMFAHELIVHDEATGSKVRSRLGRSPVVIPHGSFADVYPNGSTRSQVRERIGVGDDMPLILVFGHIARYKSLDSLIPALRQIPKDEAHKLALLVVGRSMDPDLEEKLRAGAKEDDRLRLAIGFVPDEDVVPLFQASDVAAVTRVDDGTSGVLVLALSLGVPVIVADTPGYRELARTTGVKHWLFTAGDAGSLAAAICTAAREVRNGVHGARSLAPVGPEWPEVAEQTAAVLAPGW